MSMVNAAGRYVGKATDWQWGWTSGQGGDRKQQLVVQLEVTQGASAGAQIRWFGFFTDLTFKHTLKAMRALGWRGEQISDMSGMGTKEVELIVEMEKQTVGKNAGKTYAKVRWINPLGGKIELNAPMSEAELRQFAATMSGHVREVPAEAGPQGGNSAPPPQDDFVPQDDDAPPF